MMAYTGEFNLGFISNVLMSEGVAELKPPGILEITYRRLT